MFKKEWEERRICFDGLPSYLGQATTLKYVSLQNRQTYWCLCLIDIWHKSLLLMEGRDKPNTDKYKEITNDWNYDASCILTSFLVLDF
jgi:hypothetical protein